MTLDELEQCDDILIAEFRSIPVRLAYELLTAMAQAEFEANGPTDLMMLYLIRAGELDATWQLSTTTKQQMGMH